MPSVAEQLRRAREEQKLSVHQVADLTKMRTDHLRALEEGRYGEFSAAVYIRGFVRGYANLLKIPVAEIMKDLDAELAQSKQFRELPSLTGTAQGPLDRLMLLASRVHWRIVAPIAILTVVAIAGVWGARAWQERRSQDPVAGLGPGLYQPPNSVTADLLPFPGSVPPTNRPAAPTRK